MFGMKTKMTAVSGFVADAYARAGASATIAIAKAKTKVSENSNFAKAGGGAALAVAGSAARASGFDDIMDGVDLGSVATKIIAVGLIVVGIYLAMQGISVAKRVISKV